MSSRFVLTSLVCLVLTAALNAKSVYISINGDDANNGKSPETAVKTIAKAKTFTADTLFLKADDTFYEPLGQIQNVVVTRYGKGANPVICGLRQIKTPKWKNVGENLWQINLAEDNFTGAGTVGSFMQNNIGCVYEYDIDQIHGRKVQYRKELTQDWDIWQSEHFEKGTPVSEFDNLLLYLNQDPNHLRIAFSIYDNAVIMKNATLDGIDIKGYGFGVAAKSNSIIRNCNLDIIGGRTQIGYSLYTCYGNGIEFYVSQDIENCIVEYCTISRCYDCGITIQGSNSGKATPRNIRIHDNLISRCCQGWEDFLRNDSEVVYENCIFENNIVVNSGENGFGYPASRFKYCHVLGNNFKGDKGMIIRNNVFAGGNYYCSGAFEGKYMSNRWYGNVCYIKRGDYILSNYTGSKDVIRIPTDKGSSKSLSEATFAAIADYRALTGDTTTKFIIYSPQRIQRTISKLNKKFKRIRK